MNSLDNPAGSKQRAMAMASPDRRSAGAGNPPPAIPIPLPAAPSFAPPELRLAQHENIRKWVDVADRLGASHVRVFGGPVPQGATEQQAIAWAAEVLKRGAEYAGSLGITLGVEDDGGLTTAAGPTVEIVKQAASPWAGINADSGNLRVDGYAQFATMLPYATSVHLKTSIAGEGGKKEKADWKRLLTMLGNSGYKGFVGLEYEENDAAQVAPGLAAELRSLVRTVSA